MLVIMRLEDDYMKLQVNDFMRIKNADIDIDRITVIAGNNNTGKSTIGKALFLIFYSLFELDKKNISEKVNYIIDNFSKSIQALWTDDLIKYRNLTHLSIKLLEYEPRRDFFKILEKMVPLSKADPSTTEDIIQSLILDFIDTANIEFDTVSKDAVISALGEAIHGINKYEDNKIDLDIISTIAKDICNQQINSYNKDALETAKISLTIKEDTNELTFMNNICVNHEIAVPLKNKAIYIDQPDILDELNNRMGPYNLVHERHLIKRYLLSLLTNTISNSVKRVEVDEDVDNFISLLKEVLDGKIILNETGGVLQSQFFTEVIRLSNLSMGIKAFSILKLLIENNTMNDKDVLILDEPEIHLHPKWQITYAKLIVLLAKYKKLSILITTHSPYFLNAIEVYSKKYGIDEHTNYYYAENTPDRIPVFRNVNKCIEEIYNLMAEPWNVLGNVEAENERI